MTDATKPHAADKPLKVLVYSDDAHTREQVILALGKRPHPDLPDAGVRRGGHRAGRRSQQMDTGAIDLAILDGEAVPAGGHGHRQADEGRDLPVPAGAGAHRSPAGRVAGDLVARRGRRTAPDRPDPARRGRRPACSASASRRRRPRRPPDALTAADVQQHSWPEVLSALVARTRPDRRPDGVGDGRDPGRRGDAGADRRVRGRAARQGRDRRRGRGPGRGDVRPRDAAHRDRAGARHRRHRRRPVDVGEHLHDGRDRRGGRRGARWSSTATAPPPPRPAAPTCSRRSGSGSTCPPTRWPRWGSEAGITFCFAAAFHPALRHAAVPRRELGVGTTFNFLGPLANPAKPEAQAIGCADVADGAGDGRCLRPPRRRRLGLPRRRRARRADHHDDLPDLGGVRRRGRGAHARPGRPRHRPRDGRGPARPATPPTTPTSYDGWWPASTGRSATPWCSTPGPPSRCTPPSPAPCWSGWPPGSPGRHESIDSGSAQRTLDLWVAVSASQ